MPGTHPHVIIIGGGFGGLYAAEALRPHPVRITLIDKKNHHTFQPLLYQVATAGLSPGDIAAPIRGILRKARNVEVLLGEVVGFDLEARRVRLADFQLSYDYLIVATGARHSYFAHPEWETIAPGLKTIEDALEIRRRVLSAYELAERNAARGQDPGPLNFVIIGAGPTGVELAGALAEISRQTLPRNFRFIDPARARIILLEGASRVLPAYPEDLSRSAEQQLKALGVEVRTGTVVTAITPGEVRIGDTRLPAAVTLWAAGVAASPLGKLLGAPTDRAGRVLVEADLTVRGHPEVFVIGDLAAVKDTEGKMVPGVAPAAIQMGRAAAANIIRDLHGEARRPFLYDDRGNLATIGRAAAVADFGRIRLSGFMAWIAWLFIHLFWLIGFRNRVLVMIEWAWYYFTAQRGTRLITDIEPLLPSTPPASEDSRPAGTPTV
ncbi:MAG TPA: NAD(P)/FAD-dependent oxidoreductase [Terriglobales bacterium]|nr:NAD(P)/FAD-dependent oxidoreductase [Terriglobales bacterium]